MADVMELLGDDGLGEGEKDDGNEEFWHFGAFATSISNMMTTIIRDCKYAYKYNYN